MPAYTPATPTGPGTCPRCLQPVIWALTEANRRLQPVNPHRDPDGNTAIRVDVTGRYLSRQLTTERPTPEAGEALHKPHYATNPDCRPQPTPKTTKIRPRAPRQRHGVRPVRWQRR